jgi:hypothetical protein
MPFGTRLWCLVQRRGQGSGDRHYAPHRYCLCTAVTNGCDGPSSRSRAAKASIPGSRSRRARRL